MSQLDKDYIWWMLIHMSVLLLFIVWLGEHGI